MPASNWVAVAALVLAGCGGSPQDASSVDSNDALLAADQCEQFAHDVQPAGFCGFALGTCSVDADCHRDGCSGEVCTSGGGVYTTCRWQDCFNVARLCRCVRGCCVWN